MKSESRILQLDTVHNFRDIGGFLTVDGKLMKRGYYFRSDSLHTFTINDINKIQGNKIKSIIDLRTPNERNKKLCVELYQMGVQVLNIPIYPLSNKRDPGIIERLIDLLKGKYKELNVETFMIDIYRRMALEHGQEINRIFTFLSEKNNLPVVIHCTAGKDRTGWVSQNLFNFDPNKFKPMNEARLEYLKAAEDAAFVKYETIEKYLTEYCMIPDKIIKNIKNIVLE